MLEGYLTRRQLQEETGWSLKFIRDHVPYVRLGRKILINRNALTTLLAEGHHA